MKTKTKDRLMTTGTVLVICAVAIVLPGCGTAPRGGGAAADKPYLERCHTDTECEIEAAMRSRNGRSGSQPRWKLWTTIGVTAIVTGYLYAQRSENGGNPTGLADGGKSIQPVSCVAAGCAQ